MSRTSGLNRYQIVIGLAALALLFAAAPSRLGAQAVIGEIAYGDVQQSIAGVGDVDGDGHADFVIGTGGAVSILSGADHSVLREWTGHLLEGGFGSCVDSAGDVDGDGFHDVVVGAFSADWAAPNAGLVCVYSSATGARLYEIWGAAALDEFGSAVAGVGDLDGDGRGDFAGATRYGAGPGGEPSVGYVRIFSGADGHEFVQISGNGVGWNVRPAGDFNNDGTPDVAVMAGLGESGHNKHALVYSGAWIVGGTPPETLLDYSDGYVLGIAVDAAGDIDQDGWDDLVLGTPGFGLGCFPPPCLLGGYRVISGRDHSLLFDWSLLGDKGIGNRVAGAGDLDQDGFPDLLVSRDAFITSDGLALAFSGRDGSLLYTCAKPNPLFGSALAAVGDLNADGFLDWIVGGGIEIVLYSPAGLWDDQGHGLAGTTGVPSLAGTGLLLGGDAVSVALTGALPTQPVLLVVGLSAVNLPFHGGVFVPDADLLLFDVTDAGGARQWSSTWPQIASAQSFYFQAWVQDPQAIEGWAASNGLRAQSP